MLIASWGRWVTGRVTPTDIPGRVTDATATRKGHTPLLTRGTLTGRRSPATRPPKREILPVH